jgi:deoxyadenosine/deoxycytidine kinase
MVVTSKYVRLCIAAHPSGSPRARFQKEARCSAMKAPIMVGVGGPICSGKTTLTHALARELNFVAVTEATLGSQYIGDLHANPERWALEAQVAFLVAKALAVRRSFSSSSNVVLDRTFAEDREVFAHYFSAKGIISPRSLQTYETTFSATTFDVPEPRVIIACEVSLDTALKRMSGRADAKRCLPHEFVADIYRQYVSWQTRLTAGKTITLDSELLDWRTPSVVASIAKKVREDLNKVGN